MKCENTAGPLAQDGMLGSAASLASEARERIRFTTSVRVTNAVGPSTSTALACIAFAPSCGDRETPRTDCRSTLAASTRDGALTQIPCARGMANLRTKRLWAPAPSIYLAKRNDLAEPTYAVKPATFPLDFR
jgi:hypothetical protein